MSNKLVKLISINLTFILVLCAGFVFGQSKTRMPTPIARPAVHSSKPSVKKAKSKPMRVISLGVINGRAIYLVTPKYPEAAKAVNIYGLVQIAVVIDENGKVVSASVLKGHPLLIPAALKAAFKSTFHPIIIAGYVTRVHGLIGYNFLLNQWNWLEIGYTLRYSTSYYSLKNLLTQLPSGFTDESQLLDTANQTVDISDQSIESFIAIIRGKLLADNRAAWLFEVGLTLSNLKSNCCRDDADLRATATEIRNLSLSAPSNVSDVLLDRLGRLSYLIEHPPEQTYNQALGSPIYQFLSAMEEQFPSIGR